MKKIRIGIEILAFLASQKIPRSACDITKYINDTYEMTKTVEERTISDYLREISKEFSYAEGGITIKAIESISGRDGGWVITEEGRKRIRDLSLLSFNSDTLNAINDSLERAVISETYYYKKDLKKAKGILYSKKNFFENDHEHYVGDEEEIVTDESVKKLKHLIKNQKYGIFTFKYLRYKITKKEMLLKPIRLIHDLDESFVVCSQKNNFEPMYINIRNIENIKETDQKFLRKMEIKFKRCLNKDESSIEPRKEQWVNMKVEDPMIYQVIDLWVHGCQFEINKKENLIKITSYEHYRLMIFLFRAIGFATIIDAHPMIIKRWNDKVKDIKKIDKAVYIPPNVR